MNYSKHIGIVDVTTVGASICARAIVEKAAEYDQPDNHPEFILHSFSFKLYKELVLQQDWQCMAELILQSIHKLKAVGADFAIIPSNTPHYAYDFFASRSPMPILNLIKVVAAECQRNHFKKVVVLGTTATMEGGLYQEPLVNRDIEVILPDKSLRQKVNDLIMNEIIPGRISESSVEIVRQGLFSVECDAFILGCTELPEVFSAEFLGRPCVDTTRLLAYKALNMAKAD